ncbi:hypothetical protein [Dactylosporangium sp. CA-139066]|uniref:hypothetical protein n=1 Tax=Dactylosporangium sp. CA-139066 TaxID=3239930 RepID=UPI003D9025FD
MSFRLRIAGLGILVAVIGNGLADLVAYLALRSAGGPLGCGPATDTGERFGVLVALVVSYAIAQLVLGGVAAGLSALAKPREPYWAALGGGWAILTVLSILSVCYPGC